MRVAARFGAVVTLACAACLLPLSSRAALVAHEGYFTDTQGGLDWMNGRATAGRSYADVVGGFGGYVAAGWRYATGNELRGLVAGQLGVTPDWNGATFYSPQVFQRAADLQGLIGIGVSYGMPPDNRAILPLYAFGGSGLLTRALFDDMTAAPGLGMFGLDTGTSAWGPSFTDVFAYADASSPTYSSAVAFSLLVRETGYGAVPEPSGAALATLALAALALATRRNPGAR